MKDLVGWECPIFIDQEGGRVQRLSNPSFLKYPPAKLFGEVAKINIIDAVKAVDLNYSLIGKELKSYGINVNCAPCIDVISKQTHEVIGDRAFSNDARLVAKLGLSACNGLLRQGVVPVIKHIPGHGRGNKDSHKELPFVKDSLNILQNNDFVPFKKLSKMPFAMTAHIIYNEIDDSLPISVSLKAHEYIRSVLKYEGILMTDDISMKALSGSIKEKIYNINNAGYDLILHCSGEENEIINVLEHSPIVKKEIFDRWLEVNNSFENITTFNIHNIMDEINKILSTNVGIKWKYK